MNKQEKTNEIDEQILLNHLTVYRNEIWSITNSILSQRDKLFETETYIRCQDPNNFVLDPNPEPHEIVTNILNNASRLQKIFIVASKRDGESESQFEFRKERGEILRKRFLIKQNRGLMLFKTSARNSIEHFDERVDVLMKSLIENDERLDGRFLLYSMTLNSKELFEPWDLVFPIKVLITSTLEYFMVNNGLEKEYVDLKTLFIETEKIQTKLKEYVDKYFSINASERTGPIGAYIPINYENKKGDR